MRCNLEEICEGGSSEVITILGADVDDGASIDRAIDTIDEENGLGKKDEINTEQIQNSFVGPYLSENALKPRKVSPISFGVASDGNLVENNQFNADFSSNKNFKIEEKSDEEKDEKDEKENFSEEIQQHLYLFEPFTQFDHDDIYAMYYYNDSFDLPLSVCSETAQQGDTDNILWKRFKKLQNVEEKNEPNEQNLGDNNSPQTPPLPSLRRSESAHYKLFNRDCDPLHYRLRAYGDYEYFDEYYSDLENYGFFDHYFDQNNEENDTKNPIIEFNNTTDNNDSTPTLLYEDTIESHPLPPLKEQYRMAHKIREKIQFLGISRKKHLNSDYFSQLDLVKFIPFFEKKNGKKYHKNYQNNPDIKMLLFLNKYAHPLDANALNRVKISRVSAESMDISEKSHFDEKKPNFDRKDKKFKRK